MSRIMKKLLTLLVLISSLSISAQRIIFPGQELLFPHINDPSFVGANEDVTVMAMLQLTDDERKQHSQFINAQLPVAENLSFGVDYFKDALDFYNYSTAMASAAYKISLGEGNSAIRLGFSAGIDSRRQERVPLEEIPNMEEFVPRINESDIGFNYRFGAHYQWNNLTIGAYYNRLPIQSVLARINIEDLVGYWIEEGFTAHIRYGFDITEAVRLTPLVRYLSYANDPIYEGALLVDIGDWASASVSYKNDYSINPAVRVQLFDALQIGYSYEKSFGDVNFEDVHALSIAYKIKGDKAVESEWIQNAEATNKKISAIKPKKNQKPEIEEKIEPEAGAEQVTKVEEEQKEVEPIETVKTPEPVAKDAKVTTPIVVQAPEKETPEPTSEVKEEVAPVAVKEVTKPADKPGQEVRSLPEVVKEEQPTAVEPSRSTVLKARYYVVVGSFDSQSAAEAEKSRLKKMDYYVTIGKRAGDDKFYLFIDSDRTEENATKRLRAHKLDKNFRDAYLLKVD